MIFFFLLFKRFNVLHFFSLFKRVIKYSMFFLFLSQKWESNGNINMRKHTRDKKKNEKHINMYISIIWFWIHKISNEQTYRSTKIHIRKNKITKHLEEVEEGRSSDHFEYGSKKLYKSTNPTTHKAEHLVSLTFKH